MYLSKIKIQNFRGIKQLSVRFNPNINIIIGENGSCKSALIDAIRLLYNLGEQRRTLFVSNDDFHIDTESLQASASISITYEFRGLSEKQKGALFEYMVVEQEPDKDYAQIAIQYERRENKGPRFDFFTGKNEGQKADHRTFELFQHYFLDALRDSTKDLLSGRRNILGELIQRSVSKSNRSEDLENILVSANQELLEQPEVESTRDSVNSNLDEIFKQFVDNRIGLHIEKSRVESMLNLVKPYLPFDRIKLMGDGMSLQQNSLGYNNLIYIATVLGDIRQRVQEDSLTHFALLIEEPEAHLHPQLQLSLYNFLTATNNSDNSQLFITTHSPTLTSKVPLDNLVLLDEQPLRIGECFVNRASEKIVQDTTNNQTLSDQDFFNKKQQLQRYLDVTRSQLFFSKGVLLVEGISEQLLVPAFCQLMDYNLEDYRIELVNVRGVSFYPFLTLFNSPNLEKRLLKSVAVISDDDRFAASKEAAYSFPRLIENNFALLPKLHASIATSLPSSRANNILSFANGQVNISVELAYKTLEYVIAYSNVGELKSEFEDNDFVAYIKRTESTKYQYISDYVASLRQEKLSDDQRHMLAILLWKSIPSKASFAQDFAIYLIEKHENTKLSGKKSNFIIPKHIASALTYLVGSI